MSRLHFKDEVYSYKDLLKLHIKGIEFYSKGEVIDEETGVSCDVTKIREQFSCLYIHESITKRQQNKTNDFIKLEALQEKINNETITKSEMFDYLKLTGEDKISPNYNYDKGYIIVNLNKIPFQLTDAEYGKFNKMISFLSTNHYNRVQHNNGKRISKEDISKFLGYKKVEYLNKYLRKLKKYRIVDEQSYGGVKYLIINPAYAKKNMEIDSTIYKMFKADLDECLTENQIKYLNMQDESVEISSMIPIDD